MTAPALEVEVVYAGRERIIARSFRLQAGSRVADALRLAALDPAFAGLELADAPAGIFGRACGADQPLENGDRVEIYRPLAADPKSARRARAGRASKFGRS